MQALRTLSKILILIPIAMLIYDLVDQWFVHARVYIQTFQEWLNTMDSSWPGKVRPILQQTFSSEKAEKIMKAPGPLVMAVPPVVIYIFYRIVFMIRGGQSGGTITYKSHD